MLALEQGDEQISLEAIADTLEACIEETISARSLPIFDIEYLFTQIRSKSVGETTTIQAKCTECDTANEITVDISKVNSSSGAAQNDLLQIIDVPAETLVLHAGIEVLTALSSSVTLDLGMTDVDNFVDGDTNATGYATLTATARPAPNASADTIDITVLSADSTAGKVRVWAILCDVSGTYETASNA